MVQCSVEQSGVFISHNRPLQVT